MLVLDLSSDSLVLLNLRLMLDNLKVSLEFLDLAQNLLYLLLTLELEDYLHSQVQPKPEQYLHKHLEFSHSLDLLLRRNQEPMLVLDLSLDSPVLQNPLQLLHQHSLHYLKSVVLLENLLYLLHILDLVLYVHSQVQQKPEQYFQNPMYSLSSMEIRLKNLQGLNLDLDLSLELLGLTKQQKSYPKLQEFYSLYLDLLEKVSLLPQKLHLE